ncbi:MAG: hypothetical protein NTV34_22070 [Proteobacteria bacterium]|nr:hypothetical protein [Pseudomonadota bacterium]
MEEKLDLKASESDLGSSVLSVISAGSELAATRLKDDLTKKLRSLLTGANGFRLLSVLICGFICVMALYFALHRVIFMSIPPSMSDGCRDMVANLLIFCFFLGLTALAVRSASRELSDAPKVSLFRDKNVSKKL